MRSQQVLFTAVVCCARIRVTWSSVRGAPPPDVPGSAAPGLGPLPDPAIKSRRAGSATGPAPPDAFVVGAEGVEGCAAIAIFGGPPSAPAEAPAALSFGLGATA